METKLQRGEGEARVAVRKDRLPVQTVERLHRYLAGDAHTEMMVLKFIADKYGAANLLQLPPHVARAILKRPVDFLAAVKRHCEPELLAEGHHFFSHR